MGELPDLLALRLLLALDAEGTVTAAAERLHLSQPAATHQLRRLARLLGAPLLVRQGRGVALTAVGRAATARARRALAELDALRDDVRSLAGLEGGEVRVGGGTTATIYLLPARIAAFRARHPGVGFYLREAGSAAVLAAIAAGELEVGIVGLPASHPGVAVTPWLEDPLALIAWPGAPLAGSRVAAGRLDDAPFIHAPPGAPLRAAVDAAMAKAGVAPRTVMELESVEAIKACVLAGLGYAIVSQRAVARELADGRLVALTPRGMALARPFGIATRAGGPIDAAARAFVASLQA